MNLRCKGLVRIKSKQVEPEITKLAEVVKALEPKVVVEIGTAYGGTLFMWSQFASKKVISCDLEHPWYKQKLYEDFPPPGSGCQVVPVVGDSSKQSVIDRVKSELAGEPIDFLFIDGDHTDAGVRADFANFRDLVRPGGLIAFHDIVERPHLAGEIEVHLLWNELHAAQDLDTEEVVAEGSPCGIGLLRVAQS